MTGNGEFTWALPFWQQPAQRSTGMMDAGVRASFVAALFAQPDLMRRSGRVLVAAQLAIELGVRDIDGRQPHPLTIETASKGKLVNR